MDQERRKHKRIGKNFIIKVRPKQKESEGIAQAAWNTVNAENLSGGGILFYYHKKIEIGQTFDFQIYFPPSRTNINCAGKIVRVFNPSGSVIFRIGAEFSEITEKERNLINKEAKKFKPGK